MGKSEIEVGHFDRSVSSSKLLQNSRGASFILWGGKLTVLPAALKQITEQASGCCKDGDGEK